MIELVCIVARHELSASVFHDVASDVLSGGWPHSHLLLAELGVALHLLLGLSCTHIVLLGVIIQLCILLVHQLSLFVHLPVIIQLPHHSLSSLVC